MNKALLSSSIWKKSRLWIDEIVSILKSFQMGLLATSLSFITTISLVPLVAVSLSVFQYLGGLEILINDLTPRVLNTFSPNAGQEIINNISAIAEQARSGALGGFGFISFLLSSTYLVRGVEMAIQKVWGIKSSRRLIVRLGGYWSVIFFTPLLFAGLVGLRQSGWIPLLAELEFEWLMWLVATAAFILIFKWVPTVVVSWRSAIYGGAFTGVVLLISKTIYVWALENALLYNKIYGSVASIPVFLIWIVICWYIFFIGAAISARSHHTQQLT